LLTLRHAEVVAGQVIALSSAVVTVEDSVLRELQNTARLFMAALAGALAIQFWRDGDR
jgi:hypothetical protein